MSAVPVPDVRCANEGCARPSEPGERYCSICGLERSLFDPNARRQAALRRAEDQGETDRR
jgi:hypothetical protein